jgi:hypothetical protein
MGWATKYIQSLKEGHTVSFRPHGNSMSGKIESGQLCTVVPANKVELDVGDIVLCKVHGREFLHIIKAVKGEQYQIGNNHGGINGWTSNHQIYGKCIHVSD